MGRRRTWQSWYLRFSSSSPWRWRCLPVGRPPSPSCCASTAPVDDEEDDDDGDDDDHDDDDNDNYGVNDKDEADQSPHGSRRFPDSQWRTIPTKLRLSIESIYIKNAFQCECSLMFKVRYTRKQWNTTNSDLQLTIPNKHCRVDCVKSCGEKNPW